MAANTMPARFVRRRTNTACSGSSDAENLPIGALRLGLLPTFARLPSLGKHNAARLRRLSATTPAFTDDSPPMRISTSSKARCLREALHTSGAAFSWLPPPDLASVIQRHQTGQIRQIQATAALSATICESKITR